MECHLLDPLLQLVPGWIRRAARLIHELPREDGRVVLVHHTRVRVHPRQHVLDVVLEVDLHGLVGKEVIVIGGGDVEAAAVGGGVVPGPFDVLRLAAVAVPVVDQ